MDLILINTSVSLQETVTAVATEFYKITRVKTMFCNMNIYPEIDLQKEVPVIVVTEILDDLGKLSLQLNQSGLKGVVFYVDKSSPLVTFFGDKAFETFVLTPQLLGCPRNIKEREFIFLSLMSLCLFVTKKEASLLKASDRIRKLLQYENSIFEA